MLPMDASTGRPRLKMWTEDAPLPTPLFSNHMVHSLEEGGADLLYLSHLTRINDPLDIGPFRGLPTVFYVAEIVVTGVFVLFHLLFQKKEFSEYLEIRTQRGIVETEKRYPDHNKDAR